MIQMEINAIRKDLLDSYLKKTKKAHMDSICGKKFAFETDGMLVNWRRWPGYFLYTKDSLEQHIYSLSERK